MENLLSLQPLGRRKAISYGLLLFPQESLRFDIIINLHLTYNLQKYFSRLCKVQFYPPHVRQEQSHSKHARARHGGRGHADQADLCDAKTCASTRCYITGTVSSTIVAFLHDTSFFFSLIDCTNYAKKCLIMPL